MGMPSNNYLHITANGAYTVKADFPTVLETVKVNFADSAGTIKITESDSTKIIANKIDNTKVYKHEFDLTNLKGLIVTVASGSAPDITVIYQ